MSDDAEASLPRSFRFLPLTLHLETLGGIATPLVLRGTPLPAIRDSTFSTADDNQTTIEISVLLGESPIAANNAVLGRVRLSGIEKAPRGTPQIKVVYRVDRHCRIKVSASIANTDLTVEADLDDPQPLLTDTAIAQALARAEEEKEADQIRLRDIEISNDANATISEAEFVLTSKRSTLSDQRRSEIASRVADLGLAIEGGTLDRIHAATHSLRALLSVHETESLESLFFHPFFTTASPSRQPNVGSRPVDAKRSKAAGSPTQRPVRATTGRALGRVFGGGDFALDSNLCFVLMPFAAASRPIYDDHIRKVALELGLSPQRADDIASTNQITWDIWERINRARLVVADLTDRNPNVFYEVGLAHAISKDVILLTRNVEDIPFDLKALRFIEYQYTPRGMQDFERKLRSAMQNLMHSS